MTAQEIIEQRDALIQEAANSREASGRHRQRVNELEGQLADAVKRQLKLHEEAARGREGSADELAELAAELVEAKAEVEEARVAMQGAENGQRNAQEELANLYRRELAAFAEEADEATQAAQEALAELREPYEAAEAAWAEAERRWAPLHGALKQAQVDADVERGIYRDVDSRTCRVPGFPVSASPMVFDRAVARPPAVREVAQD